MASVANMGACAHNPRGNLWFNDDTTYGHKLLMKMGWSKGKGLGKNEDGIKENLSVKFKGTNSGLGYKDDPYANIMKTEYESILKSLSANYPQKGAITVEKDDKEEDKSSEQRSKVVKGKPRYSRLFYGKDVTKYSEKDMKSIFICSLPSNDNQEALEGSTSLQKQVSEVECPIDVKTSTLSISDYFAKKMKEKKINVLSEETISEPSQEQAVLDADIISKKKKGNSEINSNKESVNDSDKQQTALIGTEDNFIVASKKKSSSKKKRKSEISTNETGSVDACDLEIECIVSKKKKQQLSENVVCENNVSEIDKTSNHNSTSDKKRRKSEMSKNSFMEILSDDASEGKNSQMESSDKKRRKSGMCESKNSPVEIFTNDAREGKISCQIELSSDKILQLKKKRKKYDKESSIPTDANELSLNYSMMTNGQPPPKTEDELLNNTAIPPKKKKKSKKNKLKKLKSCLRSRTGNYSVKSVSFSENVSYCVIDSDCASLESLSDECSTTRERLANSENFSVDSLKSESGNSSSDIQVISSDNHKGNNSDADVDLKVLDAEFKAGLPVPESSVCEGQEKVLITAVKDDSSLSSLPSPVSSNYDSWAESQRQALKMKMYKNMLKGIKKHEVLKTSNLLSIKGYGNWGFK